MQPIKNYAPPKPNIAHIATSKNGFPWNRLKTYYAYISFPVCFRDPCPHLQRHPGGGGLCSQSLGQVHRFGVSPQGVGWWRWGDGGAGRFCLLLLCFFFCGEGQWNQKRLWLEMGGALFLKVVVIVWWLIISDFRLFFFSVYTRMSQ